MASVVEVVTGRENDPGFVPLDVNETDMMTNAFRYSPSIRAALEALCNNLFGNGIILTKKGWRPSDAFQRVLNSAWVIFAKIVIQFFMCYGLAVCVIDDRRIPHVVPMSKIKIKVFSSIDGRRIYNIEPVLNATTLFDSNAMANKTKFYVFEKYIPDEQGKLTSPIRSMLKIQQYRNRIMDVYLIAAYRRAAPSLYTQKAPSNPQMDIHELDYLEFREARQAEDQRADSDNTRALFVAAEHKLATEAANQLASSLGDLQSGGAGVSSATAAARDPVDDVVMYPITAVNESYSNGFVTIPAGNVLVSGPEAKTPDALMALLEFVEGETGKALGVPRAIWGAVEYARAANDNVQNTFRDTLDAFRQTMEVVLLHMMNVVLAPENALHTIRWWDPRETPMDQHLKDNEMRIILPGRLRLEDIELMCKYEVVDTSQAKKFILKMLHIESQDAPSSSSQGGGPPPSSSTDQAADSSDVAVTTDTPTRKRKKPSSHVQTIGGKRTELSDKNHTSMRGSKPQFSTAVIGDVPAQKKLEPAARAWDVRPEASMKSATMESLGPVRRRRSERIQQLAQRRS